MILGEFIDLEDKAKNMWLIVGQLSRKAEWWDAPSHSGILAKAINTMEMQWVAYDQVVCGSIDGGVRRRAVILQHTKVKKFPQQLKHSILKK